jgi:hypothetical protein
MAAGRIVTCHRYSEVPEGGQGVGRRETFDSPCALCYAPFDHTYDVSQPHHHQDRDVLVVVRTYALKRPTGFDAFQDDPAKPLQPAG